MEFLFQKNGISVKNNLTKEYLDWLGHETEEISDRIFLIKNFLSKDEVDYILEVARSASQSDWEGYYLEGAKAIAKLKFGRDDIDNLVDEGVFEITTNWIDKSLPIQNKEFTVKIEKRVSRIFEFDENLEFKGFSTIQRQYSGTPLVDHVDNDTDNSLEYALVFYLNNDYNGGQIYFVNQNIQMVPDPGSLLIFPTSSGWRHGVREVLDGPTRYVVPCFTGIKNFWQVHKENKYDLEKIKRVDNE
jgi:hypothetical protein